MVGVAVVIAYGVFFPHHAVKLPAPEFMADSLPMAPSKLCVTLHPALQGSIWELCKGGTRSSHLWVPSSWSRQPGHCLNDYGTFKRWKSIPLELYVFGICHYLLEGGVCISDVTGSPVSSGDSTCGRWSVNTELDGSLNFVFIYCNSYTVTSCYIQLRERAQPLGSAFVFKGCQGKDNRLSGLK